MKIRFIKVVLSLTTAIFLFAHFSSAKEERAPSEIIERIKEMLEAVPEIADSIPELKVTRDADGNVTSILYNSGSGFIDIGDLKKDALVKLYSVANNERARIQTERIQRQIQQSRPPTLIPRPPQIVTPPSVPRIPTVPVLPNIPKIPVPPPAPPRR